jgi:hypothetical protein
MTARSILPVALFVSVVASLLTLSLDARAQDARYDHPLGVQLMLGFAAQHEIDDVEIRAGGVEAAVQIEPEQDLDGNFGVAAFYLFELGSGMGLGPRLAFVSAETDQLDETVNVFDLTAVFRYAFATPSVIPYLDLGLGLSYGTSEFELFAQQLDTSGVGFHLLLGGGVMFEVADAVALGGGLYFQAHSFPSFQGDGQILFVNYEVEYQANITRFLFAVAAQF